MNTFTKLLAGTTAALAVAAIAAPSQAALQTFAGGNADATTAFTFTRDAGGVGGTLASVAPTWEFNFTSLFPSLQALGNLQSSFTFTATTTEGFVSTPAVAGNAGLNGSFSYTYTGPTEMKDGVTLTTGENLLSGTFGNAWIQGTGGTGDADATTSPDAAIIGTVNASSDLVSFGSPFDFDFSFTLTGIASPGLKPGLPGCTGNGCFTDGSSYNNFSAGGSASFAADSVNLPGVPEPATWSLMILGFGGAGALLRNRRRTVAVAA
jgi:PEP-CTERM motif